MPVMPPLTPPTASDITVTEARLWVRDGVRDAGGDSTVYSDTLIDRAIQVAGDHFCRTTKYLTQVNTVAIADASTAFDVSGITGFRAERVIDVWVTGEEAPLNLVDYPSLNRLAATDPSEGPPTSLAFVTATANGVLHPTPDQAYTAKVRSWTLFTEWTPGGSGSTVLNIPRHVLKPVLMFGAASVALAPSPEEGYAALVDGKYADYVKRLTGAGNLGSRTLTRNPVDSVPVRRETRWVMGS